MSQYKILDLFAGVGGLSLGFEMVKDAKGQPVFELHRAVEIDPLACETMRKRHGTEKIIEGDITKPDVMQKIIGDCKGKVSIVVGGIPCQSFSLIGPRSGFGKKMEKFRKDKRDNLYEHFRDIVAEVKPNIIIIENVKGILSKKDGRGTKIIDKLITDFEGIGYHFDNVAGEKWHLLNAADFGVPQKRERVIIIGIKNTWKIQSVPTITPTHYNPAASNAKELEAQGLKPYVTIFDAIGDLPKVTPKLTGTGLSAEEYKQIKRKNKWIRSGKDRIEFDRVRFRKHCSVISNPGKEFLHFVRPNGYAYIDHHTSRPQQLSDIELFRSMRPGENAIEFMIREPVMAKKLIKYGMTSFKDKYRKQCVSEPSTTIFAHLQKDGNRFIHPKQARTFTPREAARLQSFPDDFLFEGSPNFKFRQIGNAVPPLLANRIATTTYHSLIQHDN